MRFTRGIYLLVLMTTQAWPVALCWDREYLIFDGSPAGSLLFFLAPWVVMFISLAACGANFIFRVQKNRELFKTLDWLLPLGLALLLLSALTEATHWNLLGLQERSVLLIAKINVFVFGGYLLTQLPAKKTGSQDETDGERQGGNGR